MSSAEDISQLFIQTGIMPGTLVGQNAVSKTYVDGELAQRDIDIASKTLIDGMVTTPKLAEEAVTSPKIADEAIELRHLTPELKTIETLVGANAKFAEVDAQLAETVKKDELSFDVRDYGLIINSTTIQAAISAAKIAGGGEVVIPGGTFECSAALIANASNLCLTGAVDVVGGKTTLKFINDTAGIFIESGYRQITVKNLTIIGADTSTHFSNFTGLSTFGGLQFGKIDGIKNDGHMNTFKNLIIEHFMTAVCVGKKLDGTLDNTFLWNCTFKDIKTSLCYKGIQFFHPSIENFGIRFERFYVNASTVIMDLAAVKATFSECNFGINTTSSFKFETFCSVTFTTCNFECDNQNAGSTGDIFIIQSRYIKFSNCKFLVNCTSTVSVIGVYSGVYSLIFENTSYDSHPNNQLTNFFSVTNSQCQPQAIKFIGGNKDLPRPNYNYGQLSNWVDSGDSILPFWRSGTPVPAKKGVMLYNLDTDKPIFFDGVVLKDFSGVIVNLTYNNLTVNGSFESGLTGWTTVNGGTASLDTGIKLFGNQSFKHILGGTSGGQRQDILLPDTHIIYVSAWANISSYTSGDVGLILSNQGGTSNLLASVFQKTNLNQWQKTSAIRTSANGGIRISLGSLSAGTWTANFDGVLVVNLTTTFGVGKEPNKAWCDANLSF